jgi:hypothetical protein
MVEDSQKDSAETVARLEHDVANLKRALGLVGVKPCSSCGTFYLSSKPGNLFISQGDAVCYTCLADWWQDRCKHLSIPERDSAEHELMRWLIANHNARVYRALGDLPPEEEQSMRLIISCHECKGTGRMGGDRCRHCLGNGNVWVVTPK